MNKKVKSLVFSIDDDSLAGTYACVTINENETLIECPFYCRSGSTGGQHDTAAWVEIRIPAGRKGRIKGMVTYPELQSYIASETQFLARDMAEDAAYHTVTRYPIKQIANQLGLNYRTMKKEVVW